MKNRTGEDKYVMWGLFQEVRCLEGKQKERVEKRRGGIRRGWLEEEVKVVEQGEEP